MAHPKRRQSKSRRNKRRTHLKVKIPVLSKCSLTGQIYLYHHAYWKKKELIYKGKVVFIKK
ncbi:50S ribosomal protein L32 [Blattabacterium cuenoti]|uniref:50S ribosomal protein L32 n=1 Tax=Blattabacterium cuenoti TaxID=1653831 RepID=UPI00163C8A07|nr:50S ribosomal protein L32 [Blattabacterium cuenoti]